MSNWVDVQVKCPFYRGVKLKQRVISCEGFRKDVSNEARFRTKGKIEQHILGVCAGEYSRCPIYRMAKEKYRESP